MNNIKGIYAASMSVLNENLTLNIDKTIKHAENFSKKEAYAACKRLKKYKRDCFVRL